MPDPAFLEECCPELTTKVEEAAREEPLWTVGLAFGAGILLSLFPIGRFAGALLRLVFFVIKPALLIFGIQQLIETARLREGSTEGEDHPDTTP